MSGTIVQRLEIKLASMNRQGSRKSKRPFGIIKVLVESLLTILILVLICGGCYLFIQSPFFWNFFICTISHENRIASPNGKYQAVTFLRDCGGAASAFTPHVSIFKPEEKLHKYQDGNVFIGSSGEHFIKTKWITDNHLVIWYTVNQNLLPTLMVSNKDGILIDYIRVETPNGNP